ncbi:MAG: sensor histidine kinase [Elusimicrobia bacterium]|nr:sensor histidine kinase [Elusimicrobiota bacterium]
MKLTVKFIGVTLVASLVPLTWVGIRVVRETESSLRASTERLQRGLAERTAEAAKTQMDGAVNLLTLAARNIDGNRPGTAALEPLLNNYPILMDLWVYDAKGQPRANLHRLGPAPGIPPKMWGAVRKEIQERGYFSGPWETPKGTAPRRLIAVPRVDSSLRTVGYVVARINLYVLSESLQGLDLGTEGQAYLITKKGDLLAHSLSENIFRSGFTPPPDWISTDWIDGEHRDPEGQQILVARAPLAEQDAWAFYLQPIETALATVTALKKRIQRSLLLAAGFAALLALGLSGFITRPLRKFLSAVRGMQEGHFDSLVDVRSSDELGEIAQAIRDAQPVLEKKVRDSVLGKMSRLLSHDMRQPIQALRNSLDTIVQHVTGADDTARRHLTLSGEALDWMDDFIEDILTVGRERPLVPRRMDLGQVAQNVLAKLKIPDGIVVTKLFAANSPPCSVDEKEVRKAVANLIKNAFEVLGNAGRIELTTRPAEGGVSLTISDNGPGIPEEKKAKLFEEFTTKSSGTGLGLLVVKRVMERHNGKIEIASGPQGTHVTLWFPLSISG